MIDHLDAARHTAPPTHWPTTDDRRWTARIAKLTGAADTIGGPRYVSGGKG